MEEALIVLCHRALLRAAFSHRSPGGFELMMHPALRGEVELYEKASGLRPGSFATLVGARRVLYTAAAQGSYAVFCLSHMHRLDGLTGAADAGGDAGAGTIGS